MVQQKALCLYPRRKLHPGWVVSSVVLFPPLSSLAPRSSGSSRSCGVQKGGQQIAKHNLHDLITTSSVHDITSSAISSIAVADIGELKRTTAVLVAAELGNGSLGVLGGVELDDTCTLGAAIWFILDLSLLDWADRGEEVDEIFVTGGPWKLQVVSLDLLTRDEQYSRCAHR